MDELPDQRGLIGERFERAVSYAAVVHSDHVRKGTDDGVPGVPYLSHLLGVASIVLEQRGTETEAVAAMLHDAVEDRGGTARLRDIRYRFGEDVADIVEACSDTVASHPEDKEPWIDRKKAYLLHLNEMDGPLRDAVIRVSMADKLFNLRAIRRDCGHASDRVAFWSLFRTGAAGQLWYYGRLAEFFARVDRANLVSREICAIVGQLREWEPEAAKDADDERIVETVRGSREV